MVTLTQSLTLPINPLSSSPHLTLSQIWATLLLKCRSPELFISAMSNSEVLSSTPTSMRRRVVFKSGMGPPCGSVIEELQLREPWKVDFYNVDTGAFINNTVSRGEKGKGDLHLTFYFEWPYPDMEEGSVEAKETEEKLWHMARETVQHTIDYARKLVREGKLEGVKE